LVDLGSRTLIDFAFIDNTSLILLCKESGESNISAHPVVLVPVLVPSLTPFPDATTVLVSVPFRQHTIQYSPYDPANTPEASNIPTDGFPSFILPEEQQAMNPVRMEVLDSSDTYGDIPKRICLLESNLGTLRTFTLPEEGLV
jgi:hypothetical protein